MSFAVSLQQRVQQLKKAQAELPDILYEAQKKAAQKAVEAAADATPPKDGSGRGAYSGTNTITGHLKQNWKEDSTVEPTHEGDTLVSILANATKDPKTGIQYASYVDQGHRLDKHFVPGLYINPSSGLLERDLSANVGIVVGTKTKFVKGEFMADKGKASYEETLLSELDGTIKKVMA